MKKIFLFLLASTTLWASDQTTRGVKKSHIVGLLQVRNEQAMIEQCLRALSLYVDSIIVLDDGSFDDTVSVLKKVAKEVPIKRIIEQKYSAWQESSERNNRNALLKAGREIGGTHFIFIDADEMFTSLCAHNEWLRKKILSLSPGQAMEFPMVNVWDGVDRYRDDALCSPRGDKWKAIMCILCDDGICNYNDNKAGSYSTAVHISRDPSNRICKVNPRTIQVTDLDHCLIHFKCANLDNIHIKRVWYMCLEYQRANERSDNRLKNAAHINKFYNDNVFKGILPNNSNVCLKQIPQTWYAGYQFFDQAAFLTTYESRKNEIIAWIQKFGVEYFSPLDIWEVPWLGAMKKGSLFTSLKEVARSLLSYYLIGLRL